MQRPGSPSKAVSARKSVRCLSGRNVLDRDRPDCLPKLANPKACRPFNRRWPAPWCSWILVVSF